MQRVSDRLTPYYDEDGITIYHGDCREIDAWDIAGGVMVTDPPYGTTSPAFRWVASIPT